MSTTLRTTTFLLALTGLASAQPAEPTPPPTDTPPADPPPTTTETTESPLTPGAGPALTTNELRDRQDAETAVAPAAITVSTTGNFGVGTEVTLAETSGIVGRFQLSDMIGLFGVVRFALATEDGFTDAYGLGAGLVYRLKSSGNLGAGLVAGADVLHGSVPYSSTAPSMMTITATNIAVSAGFAAEWFIDQRLSLHAKAGIAFTYTTGERNGTDFSGTELEIGGGTMTSFGATYWWR